MPRVHAYALLLLLTSLVGSVSAAPLGITRYPVPEPVPALPEQALDGKPQRLADFTGQVLVVNYWATWCTPCRLEMPGLERAAKALHGDGVRFVAVSMGEDAATVREYLHAFPVALPILLDPETEHAAAWGVQTLPTTLVVDPRGAKAMRVVGNYDWEDPALWDELRALAATR